MKTQAIRVKLRDGEMGAYVAIPDRTPSGAIIAIMEIWLSRTHRDAAERACTLESPSLYGNYVPMCPAEFRYSQPHFASPVCPQRLGPLIAPGFDGRSLQSQAAAHRQA